MEHTHQHRMPHVHEGDEWMTCTLCRTTVQSRSLLDRAKQRQIEWPESRQLTRDTSPSEGHMSYTNIDDAFASMLQYMNAASKLCKRYYRCCAAGSLGHSDSHHCRRFHTPSYTRALNRNPLQTSEDVHLRVHPGTYAVTAGEWGSNQQQTHMVRVDPGQTVSLDFVV